MKDKYVIVVDPVIAPIMPRYMELREQEHRDLMQALASGDPQQVALLGHRLKGTGASYGMDMLTELGTQLEQAGQTADLQTAEVVARRIRMFLDRIELVYPEGAS